jgi:hypothetical protein
MAAAFDARRFLARHGVVLASAQGPVPSVAEAIAGEPIKGSWWAHPKGSAIFHALERLQDDPDALCFKLVEGKVTFVHRRLWPALVRLADAIGKGRLTVIRQEHTASGAHRNVRIPFPRWADAKVRAAAKKLSEAGARKALGEWVAGDDRPRSAKRAR